MNFKRFFTLLFCCALSVGIGFAAEIRWDGMWYTEIMSEHRRPSTWPHTCEASFNKVILHNQLDYEILVQLDGRPYNSLSGHSDSYEIEATDLQFKIEDPNGTVRTKCVPLYTKEQILEADPEEFSNVMCQVMHVYIYDEAKDEEEDY